MSSKLKKTDPRKLHSPEPKKTELGVHHVFPGSKHLALGGVVTRPGSSSAYNTGNWTRTTTCWEKKTCINCTMCWIVCPHDSIKLDAEGNMIGVDIDKCTNCGLCIDICPTKPKSLFVSKKEDKKI